MDDDTEEVDPAIMAQADLERRQSGAIHALLRGFSSAAIVTHQPATQVSLRTVSLPFTDGKLIAEALPSTIEEMVPFDIDELQIQHQILNIDTESQVLVLITREDIIESHLDKLEGLGINPQHILIDGDILGFYASQGIQTVLHFAKDSITCGVYRDGKTLGFRTLVTDLSSLEADEPTLGKHLIERLRSTLIFFEDTHEVEIDEILLSGQSAMDEDLIDEIRSAMGVPCDTIPLPPTVDSKWGLAYALGQKGCGNSHGRGLIFVQRTLLIKKHSTNRNGIAIPSGAIIDWLYWLCRLVLDRTILNQQRNHSLEDLVLQIKETMPDLPKSVMSNPSIVSLMQQEITTATDKLDKLGSITADEPPTLTLVKALSEGIEP